MRPLPLFALRAGGRGTKLQLCPKREEIYGEREDTQFIYKVISGAVRTSKIMRDGRRQIGRFYLPGRVFRLELGKQHNLSAEAVRRQQDFPFQRRQIGGHGSAQYGSRARDDGL